MAEHEQLQRRNLATVSGSIQVCSQLAPRDLHLPIFVLLYTTCRFGHHVPAIYNLIEAFEIGYGKGWMKVIQDMELYENRCTLPYIIYLAVRRSKASVRMPKGHGRAGYQNIITEVAARTPNSLS